MTSIYRSVQGQSRLQGWCSDQLDRWTVPHQRFSVATSRGDTHVVSAGEGAPSVVVLPGTNFNAATCLPLTETLAQRWPVWVLDVPGQPGLSAAERPDRGGLAWYGRWLGEFLDRAAIGPVVIVGHSLGGGIALACDSPRVVGRVLVSPAGVVRLRVTAGVLAATLPWLTQPTSSRSARLLRMMHGPGEHPSPVLTDWMTLVARECRSSLAPLPLPVATLQRAAGVPMAVATGERDVFLPPSRLRRAVSRSLGVDMEVLPGAGHLVPDEHPEQVLSLVDEVIGRVI
ncbi:alpha/beta fold hydrolase [Micromonospora sp. LOL_014]|uniref:alpha/beta fold hydrolase n=1 Tax=Micromonospora sp. LOL_014 TaxID=3345415 RepID=UPI003A889A9F